MTGPGESALWVRTSPTDGGGFAVEISAHEDMAVFLTATEATAYALAVIGAAAEAEYDASVVRQMQKLQIELHDIGGMLQDLRETRVAREAAGFQVTPGVNAAAVGFLVVSYGPHTWQQSPSEAQEHVLHVLTAVTNATLDVAYLRVLMSTGLDEPTAHRVVENVGQA